MARCRRTLGSTFGVPVNAILGLGGMTLVATSTILLVARAAAMWTLRD